MDCIYCMSWKASRLVTARLSLKRVLSSVFISLQTKSVCYSTLAGAFTIDELARDEPVLDFVLVHQPA
jgi:hypothetical protein